MFRLQNYIWRKVYNLFRFTLFYCAADMFYVNKGENLNIKLAQKVWPFKKNLYILRRIFKSTCNYFMDLYKG